jgi:glycosyltransferase involved in cell wall biosynthesis
MKAVIVMPVFNDWESCGILLGHLDALPLPGLSELRVLIVDDGSIEPRPESLAQALGRGRIDRVSVLELVCNVGHQRAIALGIARVAASDSGEVLLIMDADGEDDPADIPRLLDALRTNPDAAVVGGRAERSEGAGFRLGYLAYQTLFRALVGRQIDFGNFCAFGPRLARRLSGMSETWNHLAATLLRARVPLVALPTRRGRRYAGTGVMNLPALIAHGLSAFAVFSDQVFARLLLLSAATGSLALVGTIIVIILRFATTISLPGWASTVVGVFALLFVQAILVCLVGALQLLSARSQLGAQPAVLVPLFVRGEVPLPLGDQGTAKGP